MPSNSPDEDALTLIQNHLQQGIRVTPLCLAIMGWLCGTPTAPAITDIRRTDDGLVWLRLSDEPELAPLCSHTQFLDQIKIICDALHLNEEQTRQVIAAARLRLR